MRKSEKVKSKLKSVVGVRRAGMALAGQRAVIFGVANRWSLAWAVARAWDAAGAQLTLACRSERERVSVEKLAASLHASGESSSIPPPNILVCDVTDENAIQSVFERASNGGNQLIDSVLHGVAAAPSGALSKPLLEASEKDFLSTQLVSAFSLISIARCALPVLRVSEQSDPEADGSPCSISSITSLTYIGSSRAVTGYGIMGAAKASLESSTRYLAQELGPQGVRVNCVSAPPLNTLSARGIPGFKAMQQASKERSLFNSSVSHDHIADVTTFLASSAGQSMTGQILHADAGFGESAF